MSSSNISHSTQQKHVTGHLATKNEIHDKAGDHGHINNHEKHDTTNHNTVHSIKDSKKHTPVNIHTKNSHSGNDSYNNDLYQRLYL